MSLLDDVERFHEASVDDRRAAQRDLVAALGPDWTAGDVDPELDALPLAHAPTGLAFVAVPGGRLQMGLSDDDVSEASEHIDWTPRVRDWMDEMIARARPVHDVVVAPFLCAREVLKTDVVLRLTAGATRSEGFSRDGARALVEALGLRLVSEAEWEWLARDARGHAFVLDVAARRDAVKYDDRRLPSRFGVREPFFQQWVEDDWHPSYAGAPGVSAPWMGGDPAGLHRGGFFLAAMQDTSELLYALAGARFPAEEHCWLRLALTLPGV